MHQTKASVLIAVTASVMFMVPTVKPAVSEGSVRTFMNQIN